MCIYALGTIPLLNTLIESQPTEKPMQQVAFADDMIGGGELKRLRQWWDAIVKYGPLFGYHANAPKTWLVVKELKYDLEVSVFYGHLTT